MIIGKWIDDVFVVSSENGNLTLDIPSYWRTRDGNFKFIPNCRYARWKRKHRKEIAELKKLSGNKITLKEWRTDQQNELIEWKKELVKNYWIVVIIF